MQMWVVLTMRVGLINLALVKVIVEVIRVIFGTIVEERLPWVRNRPFPLVKWLRMMGLQVLLWLALMLLV